MQLPPTSSAGGGNLITVSRVSDDNVDAVPVVRYFYVLILYYLYVVHPYGLKLRFGLSHVLLLLLLPFRHPIPSLPNLPIRNRHVATMDVITKRSTPSSFISTAHGKEAPVATYISHPTPMPLPCIILFKIIPHPPDPTKNNLPDS